jgi:hypothetical protein
MRTRSALARRVLTAVTVIALAGLEVALVPGAAGAAALPGPPRSVFALPNGSTGARVTWNAPASDGGSAITGYVVTTYKAGVLQPPLQGTLYSATVTSRLVAGLQTGKPYRFKVAAVNAAGRGPASALSSPITVGAPGRPSILWVKAAAKRGTVQVRVKLEIVKQGNGSPVTRLDSKCSSSNGGATATGRKLAASYGGIDPWVMVGQLTFGKTYKCTVTASNRRGTGVPSKPSAAFTV